MTEFPCAPRNRYKRIANRDDSQSPADLEIRQVNDIVVRMSDAASSQQRHPQLRVDIYQLAGDEMFRGHRIDSTGWDWSWATPLRDWMDNTPGKYAYRCLPLTIANQTGWWVYNPVGFTAIWTGRSTPGGVQFIFDSDPQLWSGWINNQFGEGVITWNTPFLFRTSPAESRLLICGPTNHFKHGVQPLTAIIESDWMSMSFTMNWKITGPGSTIRFDLGDPLFQVIPLVSNICKDLEGAAVTYQKLADSPEVSAAYKAWQDGRNKFHQQKAAGEVRADGWQKDYFRGSDSGSGGGAVHGHTTRVNPPVIDYKSPKP
jgi:hypothetical protein